MAVTNDVTTELNLKKLYATDPFLDNLSTTISISPAKELITFTDAGVKTDVLVVELSYRKVIKLLTIDYLSDPYIVLTTSRIRGRTTSRRFQGVRGSVGFGFGSSEDRDTFVQLLTTGFPERETRRRSSR